ncbi:FAD/NAD(P)-binding domain-containing protein [Ramaria rubella]|nr:FAD/NAD(P)-binding domain-containing protein [Ramaria rubella]
MSKFSVAISGGGIAGLCLAVELMKENNIQVDIYEASPRIEEIGANITLWGRVRQVVRLMGLTNECVNASASTSSPTKFSLRGFRQPEEDFGTLPFKDAWSLRRADLIRLLVRRIPSRNIHLGKQLSKYVGDLEAGPIQLGFADGTCAACDVLIGCDGIRSATRAQMMRHEAERTRRKEYVRYIEPRWSGTISYRCIIPKARIAARNPHHSLLSSGQIYLGKHQHIIGYPESATLNIAVSISNPAMENTRWPLPSWSTHVDREACKQKITQRFTHWDPEVVEIINSIDTAIEWAIMDLEPLPFYAKGRVALLGDAAHAAVPYIGASAAYAIEDAYVLSRILRATGTTRASLPVALEAYQAVRRPYGNALVVNARAALREFHYTGPHGGHMVRVKGAIQRIFEESAAVGDSGPEEDVNRAIFYMEVHARASRGQPP